MLLERARTPTSSPSGHVPAACRFGVSGSVTRSTSPTTSGTLWALGAGTAGSIAGASGGTDASHGEAARSRLAVGRRVGGRRSPALAGRACPDAATAGPGEQLVGRPDRRWRAYAAARPPAPGRGSDCTCGGVKSDQRSRSAGLRPRSRSGCWLNAHCPASTDRLRRRDPAVSLDAATVGNAVGAGGPLSSRQGTSSARPHAPKHRIRLVVRDR